MNEDSNNCTHINQDLLVPDCLNQHEVTNLYRRVALARGCPVAPEHQTTDEWLADYDAAEVFSLKGNSSW